MNERQIAMVLVSGIALGMGVLAMLLTSTGDLTGLTFSQSVVYFMICSMISMWCAYQGVKELEIV